MKIGAKLICGFLAVALLVALLGGFGLANFNKLSQAGSTMYEKETVPLAQLCVLSRALVTVRVSVRDMFILAGAARDAARDVIQPEVKTIEDTIAA